MSDQTSVRGRSRSAGQSMVEFALMLPVLFLLTIGVIDLARLAFTYVTIMNAAGEGARAALTVPVGPTTPGLTPSTTSSVVTKAAGEASTLGLSSSSLAFTGGQSTCSPNPSSGTLSNTNFSLVGYSSSGSVDYCQPVTLTFTVTYTFSPMVKMLIPSATVPLSASTTISE